MHEQDLTLRPSKFDQSVAQLQLAAYGLRYARTRKEVEAFVGMLSKARRIVAQASRARLTS